jgi:hypothetical protein
MLLQRNVLDGIVAGTITLAFRRWRRPTVRAGGRLRTAAGELATRVGREMLPFKADVRKLKELGLTESLEVGYRLSPRGRAVLTRLPTTASGTTTRR